MAVFGVGPVRHLASPADNAAATAAASSGGRSKGRWPQAATKGSASLKQRQLFQTTGKAI